MQDGLRPSQGLQVVLMRYSSQRFPSVSKMSVKTSKHDMTVGRDSVSSSSLKEQNHAIPINLKHYLKKKMSLVMCDSVVSGRCLQKKSRNALVLKPGSQCWVMSSEVDHRLPMIGFLQHDMESWQLNW